MMGNWTGSPSSVTSDDHTEREEAEGKEIWEKLQINQLECKNLTNEQYGSLGEYFMGQSIGDTQRHALMNRMMTNMMGKTGEEQMHVAMGKRLSGCEPDAQVPSNGVGFMPMMGGFGGMMGGGFPMMGNYGFGNIITGAFGWWTTIYLLTWVLVVVFLILGIIYFWKGIWKR